MKKIFMLVVCALVFMSGLTSVYAEGLRNTDKNAASSPSIVAEETTQIGQELSSL